jgi:uncharacterized protein HemY
MEQGQPGQAQPLLDKYATVNPRHPLYLFLRARLQAELYRNREGALGFIRTLLEVSAAAPEEALIYAARLLMESPREEDQAQGRELLGRLLRGTSPSPELISLALQDAIRREDWRAGQGYALRLLEERRSPQDLFYAYTVERGLGNSGPALAYAEECYRLAPDNDEWAAAYISALIEGGRRSEAGQMIESRLSRMAPGPLKGRYYYLRSQLRNDEEAAINDLRSGLFEDPRNLNALIALFEIYHSRKDERRAVYYLKQALAIAPAHPLLRSYEADYASLLGEAGPLRGPF